MNEVKLDTGYITGAAVNQAGREVHLYKDIAYAAGIEVIMKQYPQ